MAGPFESKCSIRRCRASSRRARTRSSASARASAGISFQGRTSRGLMMAASSPAFRQWVRNTELRTGRDCFESPKLTLETPSTVRAPGSFSLTRPMPSMVSTALRLYCSSPVARVKVRTSNRSCQGLRPSWSARS